MAITHGGDLFATARQNGWDWHEVLDFSANINPLGPSPRVVPAIQNALNRIVHYPEREPEHLRRALADRWHMKADQLMLGNGATELIFFLARVVGNRPVTLALPVFSEFHRAFPNSSHADLAHSETWPTEGLVVLTRPANPTGCLVQLASLERYLAGTQALVLVDESFLEFSGQPSAATLLDRFPQLIVLRSLTKFYALPGLRIGALVSSASQIDRWRQQREPWQVNALAEAAAGAAIGDTEHAARSFAFIETERQWLAAQLEKLPHVQPAPTMANFIFVKLAYSAKALCTHFLQHRILVRNCTDWAGVETNSVRIAVRTRPDNERLLSVWSTFSCA